MKSRGVMSESTKIKGDPNLYMAAERTLLSWIRTGLAMMGLGFIVSRFGIFLTQLAAMQKTDAPPGVSLWLGVVLIAMGALVNVFAGAHFVRYTHRLAKGAELRPQNRMLGIVLSFVLAVLGLAMAAYLIAVPD